MFRNNSSRDIDDISNNDLSTTVISSQSVSVKDKYNKIKSDLIFASKSQPEYLDKSDLEMGDSLDLLNFHDHIDINSNINNRDKESSLHDSKITSKESNSFSCDSCKLINDENSKYSEFSQVVQYDDISSLTLSNFEPGHIVVYGISGVGKSWLCNRLSKEDSFTEGSIDNFDSTTSNIETALAWNNSDIVVDTPGAFDSRNDFDDKAQQASIVDFIREKTIRCILFVFTNKINQIIKRAIEMFKSSELKENVILVCNNDSSLERTIFTTTYEIFPLVYIKANQKNVDVLKTYIESKPTIKVQYFTPPIFLFKNPINIIKTEIINEITDEREISDTKEMITYVPMEKTRITDEYDGTVGMIFNKKTPIPYIETEYVERINYVTEKNLYRFYDVFELKYAERFDGKIDLYSKNFIHQIQEKVYNISSQETT